MCYQSHEYNISAHIYLIYFIIYTHTRNQEKKSLLMCCTFYELCSIDKYSSVNLSFIQTFFFFFPSRISFSLLTSINFPPFFFPRVCIFFLRFQCGSFVHYLIDVLKNKNFACVHKIRFRLLS